MKIQDQIKSKSKEKVKKVQLWVELFLMTVIALSCVNMKLIKLKKINLSLSFEDLWGLLFFEVEVLRYLGFLLRPRVGFATGFYRGEGASRIMLSIVVAFFEFFFEDEFDFGALEVLLHFLNLSVRDPFEGGCVDGLVNKVGFYFFGGGLVLQVLKFLGGMGVLRPPINIKKDIFSMHFFYCIKIY